MAKISSNLLQSKFRGCLVGVLTGDCLGAPFEGEAFSGSGKLVAQRYFDFLNGNKKAPFKLYTDDYALTKSVATSLIENKSTNCEHVAKAMTKTFFEKPQRGYGQNAMDTFVKLRDSHFKDIYEPAKMAFDGHGSLGNGGAMRVAPLALFYHNNEEAMVESIINTTKITHTHKLGINGALLQAFAIKSCLLTDPKEEIVPDQFVNNLISFMKKYEGLKTGIDVEDSSYTYQLNSLKEIYSKQYKSQDKQDYDVIKFLGNDIRAIYSVPTAIFCFLRAQKQIDEVKSDNVLFRTIQYAISLGGDTDTIAAMAGALVGAHRGDSLLTDNMKRHLENVDETIKLADNLFTIGCENNFK